MICETTKCLAGRNWIFSHDIYGSNTLCTLVETPEVVLVFNIKQSNDILQVKEVSAPLEEKLSFLKSEVKFIEDAQKMITSTQVHIKAEVPISLSLSACLSPSLLVVY